MARRHKPDTALVTGASSGIGEALARLFAAAGYDLVLVARSTAKLEALAEQLQADHDVRCLVESVDLAKAGSAGRLARSLQAREVAVQVLVNNAGVLEHGEFVEMSPADQQQIIRLNVAGMTEVLAHFVPPMLVQGGGRVLNVASIAGFMPVPGLAVYAASKAYVLSLSEALAEELRGSGVTVTALCPGLTRTGMLDRLEARSPGIAGLSALVSSDVERVAREAFHACLRGDAVVVPGIVNRAAVWTSRTLPKWLVRRLGGIAGRASYAGPD